MMETDRKRKWTEGSGPGGGKALLEGHRLPPRKAAPLREKKLRPMCLEFSTIHESLTVILTENIKYKKNI